MRGLQSEASVHPRCMLFVANSIQIDCSPTKYDYACEHWAGMQVSGGWTVEGIAQTKIGM